MSNFLDELKELFNNFQEDELKHLKQIYLKMMINLNGIDPIK